MRNKRRIDETNKKVTEMEESELLCFDNAQQPCFDNAQQPCFDNAQQPCFDNAQQPPKEQQEAIKRDLRTLIYNYDLLIQACDGWLSAEEGDKNIIKAYYERQRVKRRRKLRKFLKFLGITLKELDVEKQYYHTVDGKKIDMLYCSYPPYSGRQDVLD
jgi:hypothetical protein